MRRVPAYIEPVQLKVNFPEKAKEKLLRVSLNRYEVIVSVFPFGWDLYLGWVLRRREIPIKVVGRWLRSLLGSGVNYSGLIDLEPVRALREAVHNAMRQGIEAAAEAGAQPQNAVLGDGAPVQPASWAVTAHAYWGIESMRPAASWAGAAPADAFPADVAWWSRQLRPGPDAPRFELRTSADRTVLLGRVTGADPGRARESGGGRSRHGDGPAGPRDRPPARYARRAGRSHPAARWTPAAAVGFGKYVIREMAIRIVVAGSYVAVQPLNAGPPGPGARARAELIAAAPAPALLSCLLGAHTAVPAGMGEQLRALALQFDSLSQPQHVVAGLYGGGRVLPPDPFAAVGGALSRDAAARYRDRAYRFRMTVVSTGFLDGALVEELADSVSPPVLTPPLLPGAPASTRPAEVGSSYHRLRVDELPPLSTSLVGRVVELADPAEAAAIARLPVPNLSRRYGRKGPETVRQLPHPGLVFCCTLADTLEHRVRLGGRCSWTPTRSAAACASATRSTRRWLAVG